MGMYWRNGTVDAPLTLDDTCQRCPEGADCRSAGTSASTMHPLPGSNNSNRDVFIDAIILDGADLEAVVVILVGTGAHLAPLPSTFDA